MCLFSRSGRSLFCVIGSILVLYEAPSVRCESSVCSFLVPIRCKVLYSWPHGTGRCARKLERDQYSSSSTRKTPIAFEHS